MELFLYSLIVTVFVGIIVILYNTNQARKNQIKTLEKINANLEKINNNQAEIIESKTALINDSIKLTRGSCEQVIELINHYQACNRETQHEFRHAFKPITDDCLTEVKTNAQYFINWTELKKEDLRYKKNIEE